MTMMRQMSLENSVEKSEKKNDHNNTTKPVDCSRPADQPQQNSCHQTGSWSAVRHMSGISQSQTSDGIVLQITDGSDRVRCENASHCQCPCYTSTDYSYCTGHFTIQYVSQASSM